MKMKFFTVLLAVLMIVCTLSSCATKGEVAVMTIDGFDVSYDLYTYVLENYRDNYPDKSFDELKELTEDSLVTMFATLSLGRDYLLNTDDDFFRDKTDKAYNDAVESEGGKSEFNASLKKSHMTEKVYRFMTTLQLMGNELLYAMIDAGDIPTDDKAALELVESDEFICVKQVLVVGDRETSDLDPYYTPANPHTDKEAEKIATKVRDMALDGKDFDSLIVEYGESLTMMEQTGGVYVCHGMWDKENEDAVFALNVGDVSPVIKSKAGYSVFKRCEKDSDFIRANLDDILDDYGDAVYTLAVEKRVSVIKNSINREDSLIVYENGYDSIVDTSAEK